MNQISFKLVCLDSTAGDHHDREGLDGVTAHQLEEAHRMAHGMLRRCTMAGGGYLYNGGPNWIELPEATADCAYVTLSSTKLHPRSIAGIAEVVAYLRCVLIPLDGGPRMRPGPEEILGELSGDSVPKPSASLKWTKSP